LLLCWYFINVSPEPQPIEKLMMKITTKAHLYSSAESKDDSEQNAEKMFVCQHRSKPSVACWASQCNVPQSLIPWSLNLSAPGKIP
jgi:hypothetical protein